MPETKFYKRPETKKNMLYYTKLSELVTTTVHPIDKYGARVEVSRSLPFLITPEQGYIEITESEFNKVYETAMDAIIEKTNY